MMKTSEGTEARDPGDLGFLERIEADLSKNLIRQDHESYLNQSNISQLTLDDEEINTIEEGDSKGNGHLLKELSNTGGHGGGQKSRLVESEEEEEAGQDRRDKNKGDGEKKKKRRRRKKKKDAEKSDGEKQDNSKPKEQVLEGETKGKEFRVFDHVNEKNFSLKADDPEHLKKNYGGRKGELELIEIPGSISKSEINSTNSSAKLKLNNKDVKRKNSARLVSEVVKVDHIDFKEQVKPNIRQLQEKFMFAVKDTETIVEHRDIFKKTADIALNPDNMPQLLITTTDSKTIKNEKKGTEFNSAQFIADAVMVIKPSVALDAEESHSEKEKLFNALRAHINTIKPEEREKYVHSGVVLEDGIQVISKLKEGGRKKRRKRKKKGEGEDHEDIDESETDTEEDEESQPEEIKGPKIMADFLKKSAHLNDKKQEDNKLENKKQAQNKDSKENSHSQEDKGKTAARERGRKESENNELTKNKAIYETFDGYKEFAGPNDDSKSHPNGQKHPVDLSQRERELEMIKKHELSLYKKEILVMRHYIQDNQDLLNPIVRSVEVESKIFKELERSPFQMLSPADKVIFVLNYPMKAAAMLTVAPTSKKDVQQNSALLYLWPFFGIMFSSYVLSYAEVAKNPIAAGVTVIVALICQILAILAFRNTAASSEISSQEWSIIKYMGIFGALCWVWFFCDFLVNIIRTTYVIFDYRYDFLMIGGASFVIWAALYLTFTNSMVLMRAMPSLAGIPFSVLLITGLSFVIQGAVNGKQKFAIFPKSKSPSAIHIFGYIGLNGLIFIVIGLYLWVRGRRYKTEIGYLLLTVYFIGLLFTSTSGYFLE